MKNNTKPASVFKSNSLSAQEIATRLGGKGSGSHFRAPCPAHNGQGPNLAITQTTDGKILFKCHSRDCSQEQVIEALKALGLWHQSKAEGNQRTEFIYHDNQGKPALKVCRIERDGKKAFHQNHFEDGQWVKGGFKGEVYPYQFENWKDELSRWVFLVEGEKKAHSLIKRGFIATTTPGGAKNWRSHFAKHFAKRNVAILPDNDDTGFGYAAIAYKDIFPLAKTVKVIELPDLKPKHDIYDWFAHGHTTEELKALILKANEPSDRFKAALDNSSSQDPSEMDEILPTIALHQVARNRLDEEAFHGIAGEFIRLIEPTTESDAAAVLIQFLIAFGNMVGRSAHVCIPPSKHYPNLFVALVGNSSVGRKGTAWDLVKLVMAEVDTDWWAECRIFGLASGEGLVAAVKDYEIPTAEGLKRKPNMKIEKPRDKRGMVIEGEFGLTLKVFQREGGTLSPQVRNAWDSGDLRVTTKENSLKSTGAHISIIGHITEYELKQLFSNSDIFNGVGNRFIWISTSRSKLVPLPILPPKERIDEIIHFTKDAYSTAKLRGEIKFCQQALNAYADIYADLARERPGLFGVLSARAAPIIQRLALIYALLDQATEIELVHLKAAIAIWEYAERSIVKIFGDLTGDANADKLLVALRDSSAGLTQTEIVEEVFGRNLTKHKVAMALAELKKFNLAVSFKERSETNRAVTRWRATPTSYEINEATYLSSSNSYLVQQPSDGESDAS